MSEEEDKEYCAYMESISKDIEAVLKPILAPIFMIIEKPMRDYGERPKLPVSIAGMSGVYQVAHDSRLHFCYKGRNIFWVPQWVLRLVRRCLTK